jgi:hypothetical protein
VARAHTAAYYADRQSSGFGLSIIFVPCTLLTAYFGTCSSCCHAECSPHILLLQTSKGVPCCVDAPVNCKSLIY